MMSHNRLKKKMGGEDNFSKKRVQLDVLLQQREESGVSGAHSSSSTDCPEERMLLRSLTPARFKGLSSEINTVISLSWETSQDTWEKSR